MNGKVTAVALATGVIALLGMAPEHSKPVQAAIDRWTVAISAARRTYDASSFAADKQLERDAGICRRQALDDRQLAAANDAAVVEAMSHQRVEHIRGLDPLDGRWTFHFQSGDVITTFGKGGRVTNDQNNVGVLTVVGPSAVVRWNHGYLDRVTPTFDGRLMLECWAPDRVKLFPAEPCSSVAIGERR